MSLLGFQEQFVEKIAAREKKHSIRRGDATSHQIGRPIQLYRRVRQKNMRKIVDVDPVCVGRVNITIDRDSRSVTIGGYPIATQEIEKLATDDGFATVDEFFDFFTYPARPRFYGTLIYWDWK